MPPPFQQLGGGLQHLSGGPDMSLMVLEKCTCPSEVLVLHLAAFATLSPVCPNALALLACDQDVIKVDHYQDARDATKKALHYPLEYICLVPRTLQRVTIVMVQSSLSIDEHEIPRIFVQLDLLVTLSHV